MEKNCIEIFLDQRLVALKDLEDQQKTLSGSSPIMEFVARMWCLPRNYRASFSKSVRIISILKAAFPACIKPQHSLLSVSSLPKPSQALYDGELHPETIFHLDAHRFTSHNLSQSFCHSHQLRPAARTIFRVSKR